MNAISVLDRLILGQRDAWGVPDDDLVQARAAVAEMIEAAKEVIEMRDEPRFIYGAIDSLRTALSNVTGGA